MGLSIAIIAHLAPTGVVAQDGVVLEIRLPARVSGQATTGDLTSLSPLPSIIVARRVSPSAARSASESNNGSRGQRCAIEEGYEARGEHVVAHFRTFGFGLVQDSLD